MVADSITDSALFHDSPISRDFSKKRKANWLWKLKHWELDARRREWIYQCEDGNSRSDLQSSLDKLTEKKAWKIDDHEEGSDDDNDETDLESISSSASSPKSVFKSKDSVCGDCFCCSKPMKEEDEDVFKDAMDKLDNDNDESSLKREDDPNPNTSQSNNKCKPDTIDNKSRKTKKSEKQACDEEKDHCPICTNPMDETDLRFRPCPCGFRLCLFCHGQISKDEGPCPGCRNKYEKTSDNSEQVSFQQRGRNPISLKSPFEGLDKAPEI